jgi:hypothetical protein
MTKKCLYQNSIKPSAFVGFWCKFFMPHETYCNAFSQHACGLHEAIQHNVSLIILDSSVARKRTPRQGSVLLYSAGFTNTVLRSLVTDRVMTAPTSFASRGMCFREKGRDDLPNVVVGWDCRQSGQSEAV